MQGTAAPEVAAALLHGHPLPDDGHHVAGVAHLLNVLVANARHGPPFPFLGDARAEALPGPARTVPLLFFL